MAAEGLEAPVSIAWTDAASVLQAIFWISFVFLFALGYSHGNKVI